MSKLVSQTILARIESLSREVIARQFEIDPDLSGRFLQAEEDCNQFSTRQILANLAAALDYENPVLFSDYISWLKVYLECRDISIRDLRINLHCVQQILGQLFGRDEANVLAEYLDAARAELEKTMPYIYTSELRGEYASLAHEYMAALLAGARQPAVDLLTTALTSKKITLPDLYLRVIQPVQHEIGRLWQFNQLDLARAQLAVETTQQALVALAALRPSPRLNGLTLLTLCVGEERHDLGARMVAGMFASAGWRTITPAANLSSRQALHLIQTHAVQVLALSVTLAVNLNAAENFIAEIRASHAAPVQIIVGGAPFNLVPHLWRRLGADGFAADAISVLRLARDFSIPR